MKSISRDGGISTYRGLVEVLPKAQRCVANVRCDALLLDNRSHSDTIPVMKIKNPTANVTHEATAGKLKSDDLFYLQSRGLSEQEAAALIVNGFIAPIAKELPLEYAVEMNRMIELEMEGAVG